MRRRALLLLVPSIVSVSVVLAQSADTVTARAEVRRRYLWIGADGTLGSLGAAGPGTVVTARIRRPGGAETALATSFTVGANNALKIELRTTKRLLPDVYDLEVVAGVTTDSTAKPIVTTTFRVGTVAEVAPATSRLRSWLVNARASLRDLAALLERSGEYHRNQLLASGTPGGGLVRAQAQAWKRALDGPDGFMHRYRTAHMDYGVYEREVLLTPFPITTAELSGTFDELQKRRTLLDGLHAGAAAGRRTPVPAATAILSIATRSANELGLALDLADWGAGPLAMPEGPGSFANGWFTSTLGATFAVPTSFSVLDLATRPEDQADIRFRAEGKPKTPLEGVAFELRVRELPDMASFGDLEALVEMLTWEDMGNNSWKKMQSTKSDRYQQLMGRCLVRGYQYRLFVVERAPKTGKRLFELRALCPEELWEKGARVELEKIAFTFSLVEK